MNHDAHPDGRYEELLHGDPDAVWPPWAAARFLSVSEHALARWRKNRASRPGSNPGPDFVRHSRTRIGYRKRALIAYVETREQSMHVTSTEAGAP